jgi:hypothetical protein
MLAVSTIKWSVKTILPCSHKDELGSVAARTMERSVKIILPQHYFSTRWTALMTWMLDDRKMKRLVKIILATRRKDERKTRRQFNY